MSGKADITRSTFRRLRHYRSVVMQQGRVLLDAEWNEQSDIQNYLRETVSRDIIGRTGAPREDGGFRIGWINNDVYISAGRFYVDGILCECEGSSSAVKSTTSTNGTSINSITLTTWGPDFAQDAWVQIDGLGGANEPRTTFAQIKTVDASNSTIIVDFLAGFSAVLFVRSTIRYGSQPDFPSPPHATNSGVDHNNYIAWLDVWQRHITTLEDPLIREKALGIPDTTTRSKTVWQVVLETPVTGCKLFAKSNSTGTMAARAVPPQTASNPCEIPRSAGYRRLENQLYRVEIHDASPAATFKWSRDNGSIVFAVEPLVPPVADKVRLRSPSYGLDDRLSLHTNDWVEIIDDVRELDGRPGEIRQVKNPPLAGDPVVQFEPPNVTGIDFTRNPRIRLWARPDAATAVRPLNAGTFVALEDGIEVKFGPGTYRNGDYWLIPARTAISDETGSIEWPLAGGNPADLPPTGIIHHYAPLAAIRDTVVEDCRPIFNPASAPQLYYAGGDGQETMPDLEDPTKMVPLPVDLLAAVSNGSAIEGASVEFTIEAPAGGVLRLASGVTGTSVVAKTDARGIASCGWSVNSIDPSQTVRAGLLATDLPGFIPGQPPIIYNAQLSRAQDVAYQPGECVDLKDVYNVQDALDELCKRQADCECTVCVSPSDKDSERIQAAIEEAKRRHGGKVCLKPGTYVLDEPIEIADATFLSLTGHGEATLLYAGQEPHVIRVDRCAEVTIESLNIVRSATAKDNAEGAGILLRNSFLNIIVQDCIIESAFLSDGGIGNADRFRGIGIALEGVVADVRIFDCFIICGFGIRTLNPRSRFERTLSLQIAAPLEIRENILCCGTGAIFIDALGLGARIHDNWMSADQFGIRLEGTTIPGMANIIEGNWIEAAAEGIAFSTDRTTVLNNRIHGQVVNPNEPANEMASAIRVHTETLEDVVNACQIAGNHCAQMQGMGILIAGRVDAMTIAHNTIARTAGGGIVLRNESHGSRVTIESNQLQQVALAEDPEAGGLYGIYVCGHCEATIHANRIDQVGLRAAALPPLPSAGIAALLPRVLRVDGNHITRVAASVGTSAGIDILAPVGMVEITNNIVQVEGFQFTPPATGATGIGHCYALRVSAPKGRTSYGTVVMTPLETTPRLSFGRYTEYAYAWDGNVPMVTLEVAKSLLLVRGNELECSAPILPDHPMVLIDQRELRCTFGGNICVGKAGPQHQINMGVRVLAETIVADSNQVFGTAGMHIAETWVAQRANWWTVLGNIVEGKILVNTAVLPEPWASLNRMI